MINEICLISTRAICTFRDIFKNNMLLRYGYTFFGATLLGRQWLDHKQDIDGYSTNVDYYFPIFTVLQFLFYGGISDF